MPRGDPKKPATFRLDPKLLDEARALADDVTAAVEEGLRWWIKREKTRRKVAPKNACARTE